MKKRGKRKLNANFVKWIIIGVAILLAVFIAYKIVKSITGRPVEAYCTDSDGGKNYFVKGTTNDTYRYNVTDYCYNSSLVLEGYCMGNIISNEYASYNCPNGCSNGACMPPYCIDTDNGMDWTVKGSRYGVDVYGNNYSYEDYCDLDVYGTSVLIEGYCHSNSNSADAPKVYGSGMMVYCRNGCSNGVCINSDLAEWCIDSDNGRNYHVQGKTTSTYVSDKDACSTIEPNTLRERFCNGTKNAMEAVSCPNGCSNGACVNAPTNQTTEPCTDSDYGKNYFVKGTTHDMYGYNITDYCYNSSLVLEGYCMSNMISNEYASYNCPKGCVDGLCLNVTPFCTDSDGGKNYFVKGTTNDTYRYNVTDFCYNSSLVLEGYCMGNIISNEYASYNCPKGCSNGACLNASAPTPRVITNQLTTPTPPTIHENGSVTCTSGCLFVKSCLPYGYRTSLSYCNIDNTLKGQISVGSCNNNFECTSNVCVEGQCTTPGLFTQFLNWLKVLFGAK